MTKRSEAKYKIDRRMGQNIWGRPKSPVNRREYGPGELQALSPGPFLLSYGVAGLDNRIDVILRWDHRVTDAAVIARVLGRLEQVLNGEISAEILAPPA